MSTLVDDLRHALRALARRPGLTAAAVLTFALGSGASTTVFSVVNRALLSPLPYPDSDCLVTLWEREKDGATSNAGYATFEDWRREARSFSSMAAMSMWTATISGTSEPERISGQRVTQGFFETLGITPALGRDFLPEEDVRGNHRVVVLSDGLFRRRFGGDTSILGKTILLSEAPYTVVGVLPTRFESLLDPKAEIWAPLAYNESLPYACRDCRHLRVVARFAPGVTPARARAELEALQAGIVAAHPKDYPSAAIAVEPLQAGLTAKARPALRALLAAVGFLLLIACTNVANLLLSWAAERRRETAIRVALGASRGRLARRLLTESLLLSLAGGALGLLLAASTAPALLARVPGVIPRAGALLDARVFAFTLLVSALAGALFGLAPLLASSTAAGADALREGTAGAGGGRQRLRQILVAAEIALALVLLVGAGLLARSFEKLVSVDAGFDTTHLLTAEIGTSGPRYQKDEPVLAFYERLLERIRSLPGVERAGVVSQLPLGGNFDGYGMHIEDRPLANEADAPGADRYAVSPDYLLAMRIPVLGGRGFTLEDRAGSPPVVLVNDTFARRIWPGESPLGKRVRLGGPEGPWRTIVGVVGDVRHLGLDRPKTMQIYLPEAQWVDSDMVLAVRVAGDPGALARAVREAVASVDPAQPVSKMATMREVVSASTAGRRLTMAAFSLFAAAALLLAAVGIYGVISANVTRRTREIGIRMALGAARRGVVALVVGRVVLLTAAGGLAGLLLAIPLSFSLSSLLFGVSPADPLTLAAVPVLLLLASLAAASAPALRATRVDPAQALRAE